MSDDAKNTSEDQRTHGNLPQMATKKKPKPRPSGPGGANLQPRRTFRTTEQEFEEHDRAATRKKLNWSDWARAALLAEARKR